MTIQEQEDLGLLEQEDLIERLSWNDEDDVALYYNNNYNGKGLRYEELINRGALRRNAEADKLGPLIDAQAGGFTVLKPFLSSDGVMFYPTAYKELPNTL